MNTGTVIYSQTYSHRGHEFLVWSYLATNEGGSVMLFACQFDGVTVEGLPDRSEAVRQARRHLDALPSEPAEEGPQAIREQQSELAFV